MFGRNFSLTSRSLSTRVPAEKLSTDLEALFSRFGRCHVKIKYDGRRRLPTAFLQFEASLTLSSLVSVHSVLISCTESPRRKGSPAEKLRCLSPQPPAEG